MIKPHPIKLSPTKLYLDDLENIDNLLKSYAQNISYTVAGKDSDIMYSSLEELVKTSPVRYFSDLEIYPEEFDVHIQLSSNFTKIFYSDGEDYTSRGVVDDLKKILTKRTSRFAKWRISWNFSMSVATSTTLVLLRLLFPTLDWVTYICYSVGLGLIVSSWIFYLLVDRANFSTTYLTNKQDYKVVENLFKNPAGLVGPTFAAIISFLLGYLTGSK